MADRNYTERVRSAGDKVVAAGKTAIHEGNARRLMIRNRSDEVVVELPLTVGVVGAVVAPFAAVAGAVAALATKCTIEIERVPEPSAAALAQEPAAGSDASATARGAGTSDAVAQAAEETPGESEAPAETTTGEEQPT
jgi:hypothetical protein